MSFWVTMALTAYHSMKEKLKHIVATNMDEVSTLSTRCYMRHNECETWDINIGTFQKCSYTVVRG